VIDFGGPMVGARSRTSRSISRLASLADAFVIRLVDTMVALTLLVLLLPVIIALAIAIKVDSPGPVLYRSRRAGAGGREFQMLKFRKMPRDASGPPLTAPQDERFTRLGRLLAKTKLDEVPQLWNVIRGHMSLVGPRPEDPVFVERFRDELEPVLRVKPGITGLSQLAFAREPEILDPENREGHYVERILPQKIHMDTVYASQRSTSANVRILYWTAAAVLLRRDVAVHRTTGRMRIRRRPRPQVDPAPVERTTPELSAVPLEQTGS
jgi:lipopolysaccharide/colanic/teichoic acid biosynthesis glycosyltransferase